MLADTEIALRLLAATGCGVVLGLNRKFHGKSAGLRTFSLVSLSTALVTLIGLMSMTDDISAYSRVVQGMLTGVGFLGAGLIIRRQDNYDIAGLTTAAALWLAACLGIACGFGLYRLAGATVVLSLVVLTVGRPVERGLARRWRHSDAEARKARSDSPGEG